MNQDPVKIDRIDWPAVFPRLNLLKALRFGYRLRSLLPAVCAVLLLSLILMKVDEPSSIFGDHESLSFKRKILPLEMLLEFGNPIQTSLVSSWKSLGPTGATDNFWLLAGVASIAQLISFVFGIGISRAATAEFCVEQRSGAFRNLKLSLKSTPASVALLLAFIVLLGIAFIPIWCCHAIVWCFGPESMAAPWWILFAFAGIPVILTWLLLVICGPLVAAAIATDRCGPADALSRCISYVLSHKLTAFLLIFCSMTVGRLSGFLAEYLLLTASTIVDNQMQKPVTEATYDLMSTVSSFHRGPEFQTALSVISASVEFAVLQSGMAIGYVLLREREDGISQREFHE